MSEKRAKWYRKIERELSANQHNYARLETKVGILEFRLSKNKGKALFGIIKDKLKRK